MKKYTVLVVDDCSAMQGELVSIIESSDRLVVVGVAANGYDALEKIVKLRPDVVTLDVIMPFINGLAVLKQIMLDHPCPIVMISYVTKEDSSITQNALKLGAVSCIAKPKKASDELCCHNPSITHGAECGIKKICKYSIYALGDEIIEKLIAAAETKVSLRTISRNVLHKKVLVIDDCAVTRKVVTKALLAIGCDVVDAKDMKTAYIRLMFEPLPHLVLLDLTLPDGSGYQILERMKKVPEMAKIPVIILTARDGLIDKLKGKFSEANEYLTKPFHANELLLLVRKYLKV